MVDDSSQQVRRDVFVHIQDNLTGDAWYRGLVIRYFADAVDTTADGLTSILGESTGENVAVLNIREVDGNSVTGHDLTHIDNPVTHFYGWFTGQVDEEGRRVVHVDAIWIGPCAPETESA
jgi:hypothetical protein